jgi:hypothetical protein
MQRRPRAMISHRFQATSEPTPSLARLPPNGAARVSKRSGNTCTNFRNRALSAYKLVVIAVELPVAFTSVTVTDVIDCTLPVTVNGRVKLNWLPNAVDAEL